MGGLFSLLGRILVVLLGVAALRWQPNAQWIERAYVNGGYPLWEHVAYACSHALPWSLGDVAGLAGVAAILWRIASFLRLGRGRKTPRAAGAMLLDLAAALALYAIWFEVSWGWNYSRAPIEARVRFDPARIDRRDTDRTRARAMQEMNRLAPAAHALAEAPLDLDALRMPWLQAVQRVGDDWTPDVGTAKPTIANPFMQATGTSGFINPLTLNVQLASDVLWFERPFALSHEWSHVAAYAREDEANYLAILTCIRAPSPVVQYSGWFELFLYLPPKPRYARRDFSELVWQDFAAMRLRDERHINVRLARWSWRTYNAYLKGNHVAAGVYSYNEVTRLVLGVPLDARGLPVAR